jgi:hypothetical protein
MVVGMRTSRRRLVRAASALVILVTVALATAARSEAQTQECSLLTQCTSVAGPWVVFSPMGPNKVIPAGTTVGCPESQLPAGSDYELDGPDGPGGYFNDVHVTRDMPGPGVGLITGSDAYFFGVSLSSASGAFRPHVGCIPWPKGQPVPQTATATAGPRGVVRTRTMRLHPSRSVRASHRCRPGEHLVRGFAGVRFHRERPPTARELGEVIVTHRRAGRRVHARVRTGPTVGDHERVTLQVLAICLGR